MTVEEIHELISKLKHEDITEHEADLIYDYMTYGFKDRNYSKIIKLWLEEVLSQVSKGRTGMFLSTFPIDGTAFPEFFDLNRTIVEAIAEKMPLYDRIVFYKKGGDSEALADGSARIQRAGYLRRYDRETLKAVKDFKPVDAAAKWSRRLDPVLGEDNLDYLLLSDAVTNCIFYFMQRQSVPYFAAEIYPYDGCIMTGAAEAEVFNGMTAEIVEAVRKMASGRNNWPDGIPKKIDWPNLGVYKAKDLYKLYERFSEAFAETFYSKLKERKELDTEIKKEQDDGLEDGSWTDITR